MFSVSSSFFCAVLASTLWTGTGYVLTRRLAFALGLRRALAPTVGWAVQNVLALAISFGVGVPALATIGGVGLAWLIILPRGAPQEVVAHRGQEMSWWVYLAAAVLALVPTTALLPKPVGGGIILASPIFDHSKIALIDAIVRDGIPATNPFFGPAGQPAEVSYYYLWHFGAAQLAALTGASGWEADAAASWFTAFSSILLMAGLAYRFGQSSVAPIVAVILCSTGSLRPVLEAVFGNDLKAALRPATGFAGWLFQSSWSPHHVAAANCVVVIALALAQLARRPGLRDMSIFACVASAAFQSSLWVGGVVMTCVFGLTAPSFLRNIQNKSRYIGAVAAATSLAVVLASPLLVAQYHAATLRGGGSPIVIDAFPVLGPTVLRLFGHVGDLPAYWLVLLPVEFPVIYAVGIAFLAGQLRRSSTDGASGYEIRALSMVTAISLVSSWLLVSTVGENNDLGWRAILPGILILTAAAAAGIERAIRHRARLALGFALLGIAATVPSGVEISVGNARGNASPTAAWFSRAPAMWEAVRRHAGVKERIANSPALFEDMTPWPVNISWALFANRRSCFAGKELAIAFAPLSHEQLDLLSAQFLGTFAGQGTPDDIRAMALTYDCSIVLLTALDPVWVKDPFANSPFYHLVEAEPDAWRIYRRRLRREHD